MRPKIRTGFLIDSKGGWGEIRAEESGTCQIITFRMRMDIKAATAELMRLPNTHVFIKRHVGVDR